MAKSAGKPAYRRVIVKVSGEALSGPEGFERSGYFLPLAAATSAAKSDSCFSIPSPRA